MSNALVEQIGNVIYQREGALTRDLLRSPADFGLGQLPQKLLPDTTTDMVCGYCSTGCSLRVHLRAGEAVNLTPAAEYPVNLGMACPKGWEALNVLDADDRAVTPLLRKNGELRAVSWDEAITAFCERFKSIQAEHGPESVAFLSTGQLVTEEMLLLGCLTKFGIGMLHGDGNTRQCMATAATAYKESFGFDAPPFTYQDFEESDVLVFVGSNVCIAHPIMWERVCRNKHNPEVIVVDPRRTETAMQATLHLPIQPKSDLIFFYAIANVLIREGWINQEYIDRHTNEFESFAGFVEQYTPELAADVSGIDEGTIHRTARLIHEGKRVSFWWTMGVNQSYEGTRVAQSLINLALMTGNIGRPGTGANSITGQCNAMGSRLFSNTTGLVGGRDFANAEHRKDVAESLNIPVEQIPSTNSLPYHRILEGIRDGNIRGLWLICTNPSHSWINQSVAREWLDRLDFLVVQDMYHTTETATQADLVLPAAGWGEKEGTFINSERRLGVVKKVKQAPGQALADFSIFRLIADRWGCGEMFREWTSPEAAFQFVKRVSAGQPCDVTGIEGYVQLDSAGGVQWPCEPSATEVEQQRRLFEDGQYYHADGRAKFLFEPSRAIPEPPDEDYPYLLLTGRGTSSQWHTQTRTSKSSVLRKLYPEQAYAEINGVDAAREGIVTSDQICLTSRRGDIEVVALVTRTIQPGQIFVPMHYEETNKLTHAHFDSYSHQPSYKNCAVRIETSIHSN